MFLFTYTAAILSLICSGFAAFLFLRKRRELLARFLAYHVAAVAVWVGSNAMADVATTPQSLIFWSGMALIGVCFFVSFYLCFIDAFIDGRSPGRLRMAAYFLPTTVFSLGAFSKYSVVDTFFPGDAPTQIIPGVFYNYIFFFLLGGLFYGSIRMLRFYRLRATSQQRMQILYMELGFSALFAGCVVTGIVLPRFGELRFFSAGPQFALFLIVCSGYAILKHRLLDIKVAIQRGAVYSATLGAVILFYLAALQALPLFSGLSTSHSYLIASILTTIAGVFGVPPLKRFFQKATDRLFFKDRMPYAQAVDELSQALNRHLDLDNLIADAEDTLRRVFKVNTARILAAGREDPPPGACPILLKDRIVGWIAIGDKLSGDPFFDEDLAIVKSFSYQCGVAVEKAKLYQQVKDYSERLEEKVRQRTEEVKSLREARAQTLIDIAHNLQTPLTILKGQLGVMRQDVADAALESFEKSIDKISGFIQRLIKLADLTKSDGVKTEDVALSALMEEIVSYFSVLAEQSGVAIETDIRPGVGLRGDRQQLEELVLNLLSNAVKYIDNERKISIRLEETAEAARIVIRDTGVGIAREDADKLFSRFYRATGASGVKGSGLGLAICKRIVDLHGGDIRVDSVVGRGTTVTVSLPKAKEAVCEFC